jgi:hypothetical protein
MPVVCGGEAPSTQSTYPSFTQEAGKGEASWHRRHALPVSARCQCHGYGPTDRAETIFNLSLQIIVRVQWWRRCTVELLVTSAHIIYLIIRRVVVDHFVPTHYYSGLDIQIFLCFFVSWCIIDLEFR